MRGPYEALDQVHNGNNGAVWRNRYDQNSLTDKWRGSTEISIRDRNNRKDVPFRDGSNRQDVGDRRGSFERNISSEPGDKPGWEGHDMTDLAHRGVSSGAQSLEDYSHLQTPFFPIKHQEINTTQFVLSPHNSLLIDQIRFMILPEETKSSPIGHRRLGIACAHCKYGCKIYHIERWHKALHKISDHMLMRCTRVPDQIKLKLKSPQQYNISGIMGLKRFCSIISKHYKLMKPPNEGRGDSLCIKFDTTNRQKGTDTKFLPKANNRNRNVSKPLQNGNVQVSYTPSCYILDSKCLISFSTTFID